MIRCLLKGNDMYQEFPNHSYHKSMKVWCFTPDWMNPEYLDSSFQGKEMHKTMIIHEIPLFERIQEDEIEELYRNSISKIELRKIFNQKTPILNLTFGPINRLLGQS
jgi:hypothetical protein